VRAGVDAVMLSTAVYPALDGRPAAFSRRWVMGQLRERLGFTGVSMTDDLGTPAVASYGSDGQRAVRAVRAGIDLPLFSSSYAAGAKAAEGLIAAARRGAVGERSLRDGAGRVLALRAKLRG
jgi:beta-N-acetylhexosaminidase